MNPFVISDALRSAVKVAVNDLYFERDLFGDIHDQLLAKEDVIIGFLSNLILQKFVEGIRMDASGVTLEDALQAASELASQLEADGMPPMQM
jgi:hypothetical protein